MKKFFLFVLTIFFLFYSYANTNELLLKLKYQAVAIGEVSLAYRIVALSATLAAAKAADSEYIVAILDEVDSTIKNGKEIIGAKDDSPDATTKSIFAAMDGLLDCSKKIKIFSMKQSDANLKKIKECVEVSSNKINKLSEDFNSLNKNKNR